MKFKDIIPDEGNTLNITEKNFNDEHTINKAFELYEKLIQKPFDIEILFNQKTSEDEKESFEILFDNIFDFFDLSGDLEYHYNCIIIQNVRFTLDLDSFMYMLETLSKNIQFYNYKFGYLKNFESIVFKNELSKVEVYNGI